VTPSGQVGKISTGLHLSEKSGGRRGAREEKSRKLPPSSVGNGRPTGRPDRKARRGLVVETEKGKNGGMAR